MAADELVTKILAGNNPALEQSGEAIGSDVAMHVKEIGGAAGLVPDSYDYIAITYVTSGNGLGEIETVTYKTGGSGGTTVATLTLAYDANDDLTSVTKS